MALFSYVWPAEAEKERTERCQTCGKPLDPLDLLPDSAFVQPAPAEPEASQPSALALPKVYPAWRPVAEFGVVGKRCDQCQAAEPEWATEQGGSLWFRCDECVPASGRPIAAVRLNEPMIVTQLRARFTAGHRGNGDCPCEDCYLIETARAEIDRLTRENVEYLATIADLRADLELAEEERGVWQFRAEVAEGVTDTLTTERDEARRERDVHYDRANRMSALAERTRNDLAERLATAIARIAWKA